MDVSLGLEMGLIVCNVVTTKERSLAKRKEGNKVRLRQSKPELSAMGQAGRRLRTSKRQNRGSQMLLALLSNAVLFDIELQC